MWFPKSKAFLAIVVILLSQQVLGQTHKFKYYTVDDGIPQSQVLSLFQDSKGYLWLGTNGGGAARFDGKQFKVFNTESGLFDNMVFSICEDTNYRLLFGTSKGLSIFDGYQFQTYGAKEGLTSTWIYRLLPDGNKTWIATQKGVFILENNGITAFSGDSILSNASIYSLLKDSGGNIWFGSLTNGLIKYDTEKKIFSHYVEKDGMNSNMVMSLATFGDTALVAGTVKGVNIVGRNGNVSKFSAIHTGDNMAFSSLLNFDKSMIYFGTYTQQGLIRYTHADHNIHAFNSNNGLNNAVILSLLKDREGSLWIGTGNGLFRFQNDKFTYLKKSNGLPENDITTVCEDKDGTIWMGIPAHGIVEYKRGNVIAHAAVFGRKDRLPDNNVNTLLPLDDGSIFIGTDEGLAHYKDGAFKVLEGEGFSRQYILSMSQDSEKKIWIGTNNGVFVYDSEKFNAVKQVNDLGEGEFIIMFSCEGKKGNMYFGTENGIIAFDGKTATRLNEKSGFVKSRTYCGSRDYKNNLWFGTGEGLYFYDGKNFRNIQNSDGSGFGSVKIIKQLGSRLLFANNYGWSILYLNDFYNDKVRLKFINKFDGLLTNESNFNSAAIDHRGRVLVGTSNGLEIYDPAKDKQNKVPVMLHITDVQLFYGHEDVLAYANGIDSLTSLPRALVLPFDKNNITFNFRGVSYMSPENVRYRYKLAGIDKRWTPESEKTEAVYPALPPGNYTFMVDAMNNDGLWNDKPAEYVFVVRPPWYRTWWFYTTAFICIVSGIFAFIFFRTRKLIRDKEKLEDTVSKRTSELRAEKEKVEVINQEVRLKKEEIEHKNLEITDSIKYAKHIQEALLPSLEDTEVLFNNCFVLYQPKDIVSGDFFWCGEKEGTRYIAAADCTGHGVPGAFMSIVGNTLLNEIIHRNETLVPGDMLRELHLGVKEALRQSEKRSQRRDGMDIALCAVPPAGGTFHYAGANRPLWIFRKKRDYELEIIKPTKWPIGGLETEESRQYENNKVPYDAGDVIYIFSDGYADQFGGPRGKKFMVSNMQKLLKENVRLEMDEQKEKIRHAFETWKGAGEQIDDVLVIGIRL